MKVKAMCRDGGGSGKSEFDARKCGRLRAAFGHTEFKMP